MYVSLDFFSVADPGLGGVGHGSSNLLSFFLDLLLVPLLLKKPHFLGKFKSADIFEKVVDLLIMILLQICIFFHGCAQLGLMLLS
jgi:hypothetical protein